ncbi:MAG: hypothetical protein ACLRJV_22755, partial [Eubacteriales bacterium]
TRFKMPNFIETERSPVLFHRKRATPRGAGLLLIPEPARQLVSKCQISLRPKEARCFSAGKERRFAAQGFF